MIPTHGSKSASMMVASLRYKFQSSVVPCKFVIPVDIIHYGYALAVSTRIQNSWICLILFKDTKQPRHVCVSRRAQASGKDIAQLK